MGLPSCKNNEMSVQSNRNRGIPGGMIGDIPGALDEKISERTSGELRGASRVQVCF